jgi:hypothetical protein
MPPDPYPDPGPDDEEPDGFPPAEDGPGVGQGLYVTLPAEQLTLSGFAQRYDEAPRLAGTRRGSSTGYAGSMSALYSVAIVLRLLYGSQLIAAGVPPAVTYR